VPGRQISPELVRAFVSAAHFDLEKVQEMLKQEPGLLHAAMNWGEDDWETALGAASHVGRRDIAEWLLSRGARMDIFAAVMLGELDIVKAFIDRYPFMAKAKGPHGIGLKAHAIMGGERAKPVLDFLKTFDDEEEGTSGMIMVENRIEVKPGTADLILERFSKPKSVHTFKGFVRMDVLHSVNDAGNEEVRVCTTWESEEDFRAWSDSESFRSAHARRAAEERESGKERNEGPIIGNKVTIYRVAFSHLPAAGADSAQTKTAEEKAVEA